MTSTPPPAGTPATPPTQPASSAPPAAPQPTPTQAVATAPTAPPASGQSGATALPTGRVELQVAHIGLIGTLLGAILAALITAILGGYFLISTTTKQQDGETTRSRAEFLRGQQRDAYQRMDARLSALTAAENGFLYTAGSEATGKNAKLVAAKKKALDVALATFSAEKSNIGIVGSEAVNVELEKVIDAHVGVVLELEIYGEKINDPKADLSMDELGDATTAAVKSQDALIDAARKDMGL